MGRAVAAAALAAVGVAGIGAALLIGEPEGGPGRHQERRDRLEQLGLVQGTPRALERACGKVRRELRRPRPVICPVVVPARVFSTQVFAPFNLREDSGTGFVVDAGSSLPGHGHWLFGAGPIDQMSRDLFLHNATASKQLTLEGHPVRVLEMPGHPVGGMNGSHVLISWRNRGELSFVSVHGYENEPALRAIAAGLINAQRRAGGGP